MVLTPEQHQKIELLDKLFGALSVEQLREFIEQEEVVAILKGGNNNTEILKNLIDVNNTLLVNVETLKCDIMLLKSDIHVLAKIMNKPYESHHISEFNSLKSRHGVY